MLRVYHLLLGIILLFVVPVGFKFVLPLFSGNKVTTPTPTAASTSTSATPSATSASTTATKTNNKQENIWQKLLGQTTVPSGWEVVPCQENATLLCVSDQGKSLGTVEIRVEPVKNNLEFQKHLTAAGIPFDSKPDYQNQENQEKLTKALQAWVADFYTSLAKNPQGIDSSKFTFSTYPPQQVTIGKLPGIRYGFVKLKSESGVGEQHIGHITYDGTQLYIITTSFAPGGGTGKFAKLENFAVFQPYLYAIAESLNLPIQKASTKP
ncbi:MAG TPA: hypothetical protein IGS40_14585 [Trichormus sp. M33_DOE_039]|nr:hypothetical protein [Trichormus sp. M33_DOE_039]